MSKANTSQSSPSIPTSPSTPGDASRAVKAHAILDTDIFKADKKTVDTQKIVFSMWENRNNNQTIRELCQVLRYYYYFTFSFLVLVVYFCFYQQICLRKESFQ